MLKVWNACLIVATFSLALLGTFLVRSGVLQSIHAFGDSTVGPYILALIGVVILDYCARTGRHATFRAGGTSLNGQSQSDDILIDVRRHWAGLVVEDGGARLRARPERSWAMPMPPCGRSGGAWDLTPLPPTWPRSAGSSPTTPEACAAPWSATPTTPCRR